MLGNYGPHRSQRAPTAVGDAFIRIRWTKERGLTFPHVHPSVFLAQRGRRAKQLRVQLLNKSSPDETAERFRPRRLA